MKTCPICRAEFEPKRPLQKCCSPICQREHQRQRKLHAQRKLAIKTRQEWLKDAERACNAYIRYRDSDRSCISCGGAIGGTYHAGHFRSVGASQATRFNEWNIHGQCVKCNTYQGGNLLGYRRGLLERHGPELLEYLENYNAPARWSIEDCKEVIEYYKTKLKELKEVG